MYFVPNLVYLFTGSKIFKWSHLRTKLDTVEEGTILVLAMGALFVPELAVFVCINWGKKLIVAYKSIKEYYY